MKRMLKPPIEDLESGTTKGGVKVHSPSDALPGPKVSRVDISAKPTSSINGDCSNVLSTVYLYYHATNRG